MPERPTQFDLYGAIASLLETSDAGNAVARALEDRYRAAQPRDTVVDPRAGHAHLLYERSWES